MKIIKKGDMLIAYDTKDKGKKLGRVSIKTGKFVGDTRCLVALMDRLRTITKTK